MSNGPRETQAVALTFHVSGDPALAMQLLDVLRAQQVRVTAFMVGTFVEQNPDIVTRIVADGHELANHTLTHPTLASLTESDMQHEITGCRDALARVTGTGGDFFRPSGTANGTDAPLAAVLAVAGASGYASVIGYDVDPADYADPGADAVTQRTLAAVQPGSIVSLHFGHQGTIDALPHILEGLQQRNLRPQRLVDLLG